MLTTPNTKCITLERNSREHTLRSWLEKTDWSLASIPNQTIEHLERQDLSWHRLVTHSLT